MKQGVKIYGKENQQDYDEQIYDDTDFYQTLLKDLIANGSIGSENSKDYWHEMSNVKRAKNKQNKNFLRNASKGRMANYDVQEKLVHFMAPDDRPIACDWNLDELFANLFGGVGSKTKTKSGS